MTDLFIFRGGKMAKVVIGPVSDLNRLLDFCFLTIGLGVVGLPRSPKSNSLLGRLLLLGDLGPHQFQSSIRNSLKGD